MPAEVAQSLRLIFTRRALRDIKKLDPQASAEAKEAFKALLANDRPAWIRFKKFSHGEIYTMHVTHSGSHKASLRVDGQEITVQRVGTHNRIDAAPE